MHQVEYANTGRIDSILDTLDIVERGPEALMREEQDARSLVAEAIRKGWIIPPQNPREVREVAKRQSRFDRGQRLEALRKRLGLTVTDLQQALGVSKALVYAIESGSCGVDRLRETEAWYRRYCVGKGVECDV